MTTGKLRRWGTLQEAAIIVFSVLIALGADAWWGKRSDRDRELAYLTALTLEIDAIGSALQAAVATDSLHQLRASDYLAVLRGQVVRPIPRDSLQMLSFPLNYSVFDPPTSTIRTLARSGELSLIQSAELRTAVVAAEGHLSRTEDLLNRTEAEVWAMGRDFLTIVERIWDDQGRVEEAPGIIPPNSRSASPELRAVFALHILVLDNRMFYLRRLGEGVERVRLLLEEEAAGGATS